MDVSPSVYEHAAQFLGRSPWEVSRDGDLMYEAHAAAYEYYHHTPIMPGIDIYNLETEAYGAVIEKPSGNGIPGVSHHPVRSTADLSDLPPLDATRDGRIPMQIEVARRLAQRFPNADIRVPVSGPFSIASNLVGFNTLLLDAALEPETVARAMMHLVEGQVRFAQAIKHAGLDVAFFESAACPPMLSPKAFRQIELPALTKLMHRIGDVVGHPVSCIIGGNTEPIVESMLETGSGYLIAPFETDQIAFMNKVAERLDVRVRINMDLRIIASGTHKEIETEADRVLAIAADRPNVCLGTGSLPYETRPENVIHLIRYVEEKTRA
ncbi:uroporphyrinogen decarboxylase family protein [Novipirellula artificiosorum]|uniref:Methylcobalamin:coenzyme M methyltransferase n=1 Tax=Novipirellula artificiosorum TaxID=2528016 RepID=A0A5C6DKE4_9BACT|nr:uroporphyrinogen decarboxylase family protein [Novipirellula artificiosorum]TWU37330.1 methylcobalamin:coenzyme M methyltransferase [Novipirellula artificiosorum]